MSKIEQLFEGGFVKIFDYPRESVCMVYIEKSCSIFIIGKFRIFWNIKFVTVLWSGKCGSTWRKIGMFVRK